VLCQPRQCTAWQAPRHISPFAAVAHLSPLQPRDDNGDCAHSRAHSVVEDNSNMLTPFPSYLLPQPETSGELPSPAFGIDLPPFDNPDAAADPRPLLLQQQQPQQPNLQSPPHSPEGSGLGAEIDWAELYDSLPAPDELEAGRSSSHPILPGVPWPEPVSRVLSPGSTGQPAVSLVEEGRGAASAAAPAQGESLLNDDGGCDGNHEESCQQRPVGAHGLKRLPALATAADASSGGAGAAATPTGREVKPRRTIFSSPSKQDSGINPGAVLLELLRRPIAWGKRDGGGDRSVQTQPRHKGFYDLPTLACSGGFKLPRAAVPSAFIRFLQSPASVAVCGLGSRRLLGFPGDGPPAGTPHEARRRRPAADSKNRRRADSGGHLPARLPPGAQAGARDGGGRGPERSRVQDAAARRRRR